MFIVQVKDNFIIYPDNISKIYIYLDFILVLNFAGIPAQISFFGTDLFTNEYAATTEFSPMVTLGMIVLWVPILQFFFKITGPFLLSIVE